MKGGSFVNSKEPKFPETIEHISERIDTFMIDIENECNNKFQQRYNVIWVTHRACVELAYVFHTNTEIEADVGFCGMAAIKIVKGKINVI